MKRRWLVILGISLLAISKVYAAQTTQLDGNLKYRFVNTAYPQDSFLRDITGDNGTDHSAASRINFRLDRGSWSASIDYQLIGLSGDSVATRTATGLDLFARSGVQNDAGRFFDLTDTIGEGTDSALLHRLDRLNISYQGERNVIKLGRQAVSWGNGLIYTPMDFFNPFDPTAIDTEYKPGDDMLYAQHLFRNGDDLQMVWVGRRDAGGSRNADVSSMALKYHRFIGTAEMDFLIAEHYRDTIVGIGGTASLGGTVIRGDWVMTDTDNERYHNLVLNISYSWVAGQRNFSGSLEYFHNDFGQRGDNNSLTGLAGNTDLLERLTRGELFTLGRDYLAASVLVEMTPLWLMTPNVYLNLGDDSALAQLVSQHDLSQNTQLLLAVSAPFGSAGSEFGGLPIAPADRADTRFSSSDWSLFAQLAWYF